MLAQGDRRRTHPGHEAHRKYLEENVAAVDMVLDASVLDELAAVFPVGAAAGGRYPENMMKVLNG